MSSVNMPAGDGVNFSPPTKPAGSSVSSGSNEAQDGLKRKVIVIDATESPPGKIPKNKGTSEANLSDIRQLAYDHSISIAQTQAGDYCFRPIGQGREPSLSPYDTVSECESVDSYKGAQVGVRANSGNMEKTHKHACTDSFSVPLTLGNASSIQPGISWAGGEVGRIQLADITRCENDSRYEQVKNFSLLMGLVNELTDKKKTHNKKGGSIASLEHEVIKKIRGCVNGNKVELQEFYKVRFTEGDSETEVFLILEPGLPGTLSTPQPQQELRIEFDSTFLNEKKSPQNVDIRLQKSDLNHEALFLKIMQRIQLLGRVTGNDPELTLYIRFRRYLPVDQEISNLAGYRLLTNWEEPSQFYVSDSLRISSDGESPLYIEFQIPLIQSISPDLDRIIDTSREYPSTIRKLKKNTDQQNSINNQANRKRLRSETIPVVKNMQPSAPAENAFTGEFLGSGIAQKVCVHGSFPSVALKFLPRLMSEVEARIVINTLNLTQTLTQWIMERGKSNCRGGAKISFSPIEYLAVDNDDFTGDKKKLQSSVKFIKRDHRPGNNPHQRISRQRNSDSVGDVFEKIKVVDVPSTSQVDESAGLNRYGETTDGGRPVGLSGNSHPSGYIKDGAKSLWVAGMQRKYERKQMVEYILEDPDEKPSIKTEIIKAILNLIDIFDDFNQEMKVAGADNLMKCIIDGNFGNFAFEREEHRLIYLDLAPATISINDQVVPGNQFMMNWFPSRQKFNYKLSTDAQMSKLFVLVMVTNQLRKLEARQSLYKSESVCDSALEKRARSLTEVVNNISAELSENNQFMEWCNTRFFFLFTKEEVEEIKVVISPDGQTKHFNELLEIFKNYMNRVLPVQKPLVKLTSYSYVVRSDLLRVLADVVANYMVAIKKDSMASSFEPISRTGLISKGVKKDKPLSDNEVITLIENIIARDVSHFLPSQNSNKNDAFCDVITQWFHSSDVKSVLDMMNGEQGEQYIDIIKSNILKYGLNGGDNVSGNREKNLTIPAFQKVLDRVLKRKITVLLIEPFSDDDKKVRAVRYEWGMASDDGNDVINLQAFSGVESLNKLVNVVRPDTLVLINHQINQPYSMGDIRDYHWSSVSLKKEWSEKTQGFKSSLSVEYVHAQDDDSKQTFEIVIQALHKLYKLRAGRAESGKTIPAFSKDDFIQKVIHWLPETCAEWKQSDNGRSQAVIKMKLSSNSLLRYMPFFHGYADMVRHEIGEQYCSTRIYMITCSPEPGRYVRWMFRVLTSDDDQVLPYMNFRGPFSLGELEDDICKSTTADASSPVDFIYYKGMYGYGCGTFQLYQIPEIYVSTGYNKAFFRNIENFHPHGSSNKWNATENVDQYNVDRSTDGRISAELSKDIFSR